MVYGRKESVFCSFTPIVPHFVTPILNLRCAHAVAIASGARINADYIALIDEKRHFDFVAGDVLFFHALYIMPIALPRPGATCRLANAVLPLA